MDEGAAARCGRKVRRVRTQGAVTRCGHKVGPEGAAVPGAAARCGQYDVGPGSFFLSADAPRPACAKCEGTASVAVVWRISRDSVN